MGTLFTFILVVGMGCSSSASNFYVSNLHGSDSNSGKSVSDAFKTLHRAQKALQKESGTVHICGNKADIPYFIDQPLSFDSKDAGGTWSGGCQNDSSSAYPPVISAGLQITNWTKTDTSATYTTWTAKLPKGYTPNQLWVNGKRQTRARLPSSGYNSWVGSLDPSDPKNSKNRLGMIVSSSDIPSNINTKEAVIIVFHSYDTSFVQIESISDDHVNGAIENKGKTSTIKFTNPLATALEKYSEKYTGKRWILDNVKAGLQNAGNFYVDTTNNEITYLSESHTDMNSVTAIGSRYQSIFQLDGTKDISFYNLILSHTQWMCEFSGTETCGSNDGSYYQPKYDAITISKSSNVNIKNMAFRRLGQYGFWVQSSTSDVTVESSVFEDMGAGAARFDGHECSKHSLSDCVMKSTGQVFPQGVGARIEYCTDVSVEWSEMFNLYGKGVVMRHSGGGRIGNNYIHDIIDGLLSDKGFIQTAEGGTGTLITENFFHTEWGYYDDTNGMYQDQGSTGTTWTKNLMYYTGEKGGNYQHYGTHNNISNNIIVIDPPPKSKSKGYGFATEPDGEDNSFTFEKNIIVMTSGNFFNDCFDTKDVKDCQFDYNLYYTPGSVPYDFPGGNSFSEWQKKGYDTHSLIKEDPKFVDMKNFNFTLQGDSPAFKLGFENWDYTNVGPRNPPGPVGP